MIQAITTMSKAHIKLHMKKSTEMQQMGTGQHFIDSREV
jgi:hypothetical protein